MGQVLYSPHDMILHPVEIFEIQVKQLHTSFEFLPKDYFILHITLYNKKKPWRILEEFIYLNQHHNFKCAYCNLTFTKKTNLQSHIKSNHLNVYCPYCNFITTKPDLVFIHVKFVHSNPLESYCHMCLYKSKFKDELKRHLTHEHNM